MLQNLGEVRDCSQSGFDREGGGNQVGYITVSVVMY